MRTQRELQSYVSQRDADVKSNLLRERRRVNALIAAERVNGATDVAQATRAFDAMLNRLEREIQAGLEDFETQQHFNPLRASLWPTMGDVAVLQARRWANRAVSTIVATRSRIASHASPKLAGLWESAFQRNVAPDHKAQIAAIIKEFFASYRFEASDFVESTDTILTRGFHRLVRLDETAAAASSRLQSLVTKVQREINATIDAAYVTFSKEAAIASEPARNAQSILKVEAARLGLIH